MKDRTFEHRPAGRQRARWAVASALLATLALLLALSGSAPTSAAQERVLGWQVQLGNGQATSYAELQEGGPPRAVGVMLSGEALASLPAEPSDYHHCFDRDGDGAIARSTECVETHEFVIPLPDSISRRADVPFKWALLNWNRHGHIPPGVYDVPHFDVHFYMAPIAEVFAVHDGPCGPEFANCDDFAEARQPLAPGLMHPDFSDVEAVVPAMGNHLIDLTGSEFNGQPFTRSWIYGMYGGRVTFYEEMVALDYLLSRPDECLAIKSPPAVAVSGYYPTQRCIRYDSAADAYLVSMEGFVLRQAEAASQPSEAPPAPNGAEQRSSEAAPPAIHAH